MSIAGALVSLLRGKAFYYQDPVTPPEPARPATAAPAGPGGAAAGPDELGFPAPAGDARGPARRDAGPAAGA
jgi:hypothetical protein